LGEDFANLTVDTPPAPAPPPVKPESELPPGDYTRTFTIWISPRVVPWVAPVGLSLVFLLSFLPWVAVLNLASLNLWEISFGTRQGPVTFLLYLLLVLLAWPFSIASALFTSGVVPTPAFVKVLDPWRPLIVGGIAGAALLLLLIAYLPPTFSLFNPITVWMKLALRIQLVVVLGSLLEFWVMRRRLHNYPPPRLDLRW
jgi:hypothetical protein